MTEWHQVSHKPFLNEEESLDVIPRSQIIRVPIMEQEEAHEEESLGPKVFHALVVESLPVQYQQLLVTHTVIRNTEGLARIERGMCPKEFRTLKGWRIHAISKMMHENNTTFIQVKNKRYIVNSIAIFTPMFVTRNH
ncbi:unnamed protein product [Onchocerca flexuosa]|uniref:DUF5641 domain-containing protein n=1 Tax=Onchocerca flexuosa TaxID=387005 RepID=A0A183I730_9BILA|nr:unnamed protein product [Onchocerca flexuosa]